METVPEHPDYIGITEVSTRSFENMRVEAFMEGQPSLMFDEPEGFIVGDPPVLYGRSRGWTPVHAQLAGLSGCTSITIAVAASDLNFIYRGLETKIRSLIDIRGFMSEFDRKPEFKHIFFDLYLDTDEPLSRIELLAEETERRCPQLGVYLRARIPLSISWYRGGTEEPVLRKQHYV